MYTFMFIFWLTRYFKINAIILGDDLVDWRQKQQRKTSHREPRELSHAILQFRIEFENSIRRICITSTRTGVYKLPGTDENLKLLNSQL